MDYRPFHDQLARCYSAVLADVLDGLGYRQQCMSPALRPLTPTMRTWGEAVTLYLEAVDDVPAQPYQLEMEAIDALTAGQLIVAQCNAAELCAFWGGLLSNAAVGHGGAGVITDGGARDYYEIVQLGFPVFCRGLSPYDSMGRMETLTRDVTIMCGGVAVSPGDLVYADVDGIVVAPERVAEQAIALAWVKVQGENKVREELRAGASVVATFEKYHIL
jgi:4-hydroxy-4-methyl-2-oxoglutarate aldolase